MSVTQNAVVSAANIALAANWSSTPGTLTASAGAILLNGSGQTLGGNNTFSGLTKTVTTADTLTFAAGSTLKITGALTLQGTAGNFLALRSSTAGTAWLINPQGSRSVGFVNVQDSNNINAAAINATVTNDAGDNSDRNFFGVLAAKLAFGVTPPTPRQARRSAGGAGPGEDDLGHLGHRRQFQDHPGPRHQPWRRHPRRHPQ